MDVLEALTVSYVLSELQVGNRLIVYGHTLMDTIRYVSPVCLAVSFVFFIS
jgi:hypothetical protein